MITGINHITFSVKSLDVSFAFYRDVLELQPLLRSSKGAYFLAGDLWFCIEQDDFTRPAALPEYTHMALTVGQSDFHRITRRSRDSGARIFKGNRSEDDSL